MQGLYTSLMRLSAPALRRVLQKRARQGKEDPKRLGERMGQASVERPAGQLLWFHAASVGEAQSTLILLEALHEALPDAHFLITTGTVTSATLMRKRLPRYAIHQYYPLDHPDWVRQFLNHWKPNGVIWMESELWPVMLDEIKKRDIPAALVNGRLSPQSQKRWNMAKGMAKSLLSTFGVIMTQTQEDQSAFESLGAARVMTTDNLKYSAAPLPYDEHELSRLKNAFGDRPLWVYASTHDGEEQLACRLHKQLKKDVPDILTIIVPRHPDRREKIKDTLESYDVSYSFRGKERLVPSTKQDIYVADTIGELGLFYHLCPIACIGRSFSFDGGGGHNPIEAAQHDCAVIHGPNIQNLALIYDEMNKAGAALMLKDEKMFETRLRKLLTDPEGLSALLRSADIFLNRKSAVLERITKTLLPLFAQDTDSQSETVRDVKCA